MANPLGFVPTEEEIQVIRALKRLAGRWPDSIWLFAEGGALHVMRKGPDGEHATCGTVGGFDPDYILASIEGIESDGGGW